MCSENFEMCSENFQMCSENFQIFSDTEPLAIIKSQVANHKKAASDHTLLIEIKIMYSSTITNELIHTCKIVNK